MSMFERLRQILVVQTELRGRREGVPQRQRASGDKVFPLRRHYWPFASSWIYFICERTQQSFVLEQHNKIRLNE